MDAIEHYEWCEQLISENNKEACLKGLYMTFVASQGEQTNNMRLALLRRLDVLTGFDSSHQHPYPTPPTLPDQEAE